MAKKSIEDFDFKFTDNGDLELEGLEEGDDLDALMQDLNGDEEEEEEQPETETETEETEEEEESTGDIVSLAARIGGMEQTIQNLPLLIADAIAKSMGKKAEDEEDNLEGELDSRQIVNILAKRIDKAVETRVSDIMKVHQPALTQASVTAQFQNAAAKYGQKFVDSIPVVSKVMLKSNGTLDVEQAWDVVKSVGGGGNVKPKVSKEAVEKKVKKSTVDSDTAESIGALEQRQKFEGRKGKNDSETFDRAFNAALLKSLRSKKVA